MSSHSLLFRSKAIVALFLLVATGCVSALGGGENGGGAKPGTTEKEKPSPAQSILLIEPRSLGSKVFVVVPGARRTVFSAARPGGLGVRHYSREGFREAFPGGWKEFYKKGVAAAAEHLKTLKPSYRRDSKKVIEYAILESKHPLTATTILVPGFGKQFAETLGEDLLIAVPDRSTVLVFPKLAGKMPEYYEVLSGIYKDAIYPGSVEIFELTKDGIRVVGAFQAD